MPIQDRLRPYLLSHRAFIALVVLACQVACLQQSVSHAQWADSQNGNFQNPNAQMAVQTRLRPLGSASAVDRYQRTSSSIPRPAIAPPSSARNLRQVAWMQSGDAGMGIPPNSAVTIPPAPMPAPFGGIRQPTAVPNNGSGNPFGNSAPPMVGNTSPRGLPAPSPASSGNLLGIQPQPVPNFGAGMGDRIISPSDDSAMVPQPQLGTSDFAYVDNCCAVSGPSSYQAAMAVGCGAVYPANYNAPLGAPIGGPITTPYGINPNAYPAEIPSAANGIPPSIIGVPAAPISAGVSTAPARALISFGQENYPVQVGQGLWGQPVAFVPGQSFRNWLRYLSF